MSDTTTKDKKTKSVIIAFMSYRILGYVTFLVVFGGVLMETGTPPGVVGFTIILPISFILILALIFGPGLSLFILHDTNLNILKTITIIIFVTAMLFQNYVWFALFMFTIYGLACISIGTQWFNKLIKRLRSNESMGPE